MYAGVDSIKLSINAETSESNRIVYGKEDYDKVFEHLIYANEYRKNYK